MPPGLKKSTTKEEMNVGKDVWYKVEDTDLWALCHGAP